LFRCDFGGVLGRGHAWERGKAADGRAWTMWEGLCKIGPRQERLGVCMPVHRGEDMLEIKGSNPEGELVRCRKCCSRSGAAKGSLVLAWCVVGCVWRRGHAGEQ
ncbi:unnamed protein product, partial [Hapterophycus canaliculatus]